MSVHPSLEVSGGGLDSFLPGFTTLDRPYDAYPVICSSAHLETIFATKFRSSPYVKFRRECIRTKDDGVIALDWVAGDDRCLSPKSPILFLLAGLANGSGNSYIRHMVLTANKKGWRVVAFNSRGCGLSPVITPRENPNCMLMVTPKGGHLGWVAGAEAPFGTPWTDPVVMEFLEHLEKKNESLPQSQRKVPPLHSQL